MKILRTLTHPNGKRRVVVGQRDDGWFTFEAQSLVQVYTDEMAERLNDYSTIWSPRGGRQ